MVCIACFFCRNLIGNHKLALVDLRFGRSCLAFYHVRVIIFHLLSVKIGTSPFDERNIKHLGLDVVISPQLICWSILFKLLLLAISSMHEYACPHIPKCYQLLSELSVWGCVYGMSTLCFIGLASALCTV